MQLKGCWAGDRVGGALCWAHNLCVARSVRVSKCAHSVSLWFNAAASSCCFLPSTADGSRQPVAPLVVVQPKGGGSELPPVPPASSGSSSAPPSAPATDGDRSGESSGSGEAGASSSSSSSSGAEAAGEEQGSSSASQAATASDTPAAPQGGEGGGSGDSGGGKLPGWAIALIVVGSVAVAAAMLGLLAGRRLFSKWQVRLGWSSGVGRGRWWPAGLLCGAAELLAAHLPAALWGCAGTPPCLTCMPRSQISLPLALSPSLPLLVAPPNLIPHHTTHLTCPDLLSTTRRRTGGQAGTRLTKTAPMPPRLPTAHTPLSALRSLRWQNWVPLALPRARRRLGLRLSHPRLAPGAPRGRQRAAQGRRLGLRQRPRQV